MLNGYARFKSWISNPRNQKTLVRLVQIGIIAIENMLKEFTDEEFHLEDILISTLSDFGLSHLLTGKTLDRGIEISKNNAKAAANRVEDLSTRRSPHKRLIKKAEESAAKAKREVARKEVVKFGVQALPEAGKKIISNGGVRIKDKIVEKFKDKKKKKKKIVYCPTF
jgi:hypothetical protein